MEGGLCSHHVGRGSGGVVPHENGQPGVPFEEFPQLPVDIVARCGGVASKMKEAGIEAPGLSRMFFGKDGVRLRDPQFRDKLDDVPVVKDVVWLLLNISAMVLLESPS